MDILQEAMQQYAYCDLLRVFMSPCVGECHGAGNQQPAKVHPVNDGYLYLTAILMTSRLS